MTHVGNLDYHGVTVKNLSNEMRVQIRKWREAVVAAKQAVDPDQSPTAVALDPAPRRAKYGLWLVGERGAGTSYIAMVVAGRMCFTEEGFPGSEQVQATELIQRTRDMWGSYEQLQKDSNDMALFYEARAAEETLERCFKLCDLLWIDDLHHETINMPFWKRHVQPYVESRVKKRLATVICTTMTQEHPSLPKRVIEDLFQIVYCDGYRPERDLYPYDRLGEG